jgi:3-oxoacyl-[acyl-carrier protein] reductase
MIRIASATPRATIAAEHQPELNMDLGLSGKKALVLAASQGLGLGVAERLAQEGADVAIAARSEERLRAAADAINAKSGGRAHVVVADLAARGVATRIVDAARSALGGIDIVVNNTGGPPPRPATGVTAQEWSAQFEQMVLPLFEITRQATADMQTRKWGRIITLASSGILQPIAGLAISNALRLSLVGWMKTLSAEVAADGVTVNVIAPGRIATARVRDIDQRAAEKSGKPVAEIMRDSIQTIPVGRYGRIDEVAAVAAFLAGVPASYITGSIIRVDGGMIRSI